MQSMSEIKAAIEDVPAKWRDTVRSYVRHMIEIDRARSRHSNQPPSLPCNQKR